MATVLPNAWLLFSDSVRASDKLLADEELLMYDGIHREASPVWFQIFFRLSTDDMLSADCTAMSPAMFSVSVRDVASVRVSPISGADVIFSANVVLLEPGVTTISGSVTS